MDNFIHILWIETATKNGDFKTAIEGGEIFFYSRTEILERLY